ncbi:MAG: hypothetical protein M1839_003304, partial [Geoglossum umbratile]
EEARVARPKASKETCLHLADINNVLGDIKLIKDQTPLSSTLVTNSDKEDDEPDLEPAADVEPAGDGEPAADGEPAGDGGEAQVAPVIPDTEKEEEEEG